MRVEVTLAALAVAKWNHILAAAQAAHPESTDFLHMTQEVVNDMAALQQSIVRLGEKVDELEGENASLQAEIFAQYGNDVET